MESRPSPEAAGASEGPGATPGGRGGPSRPSDDDERQCGAPAGIQGPRLATTPGAGAAVQTKRVIKITPACCQRCGQARIEGFLHVHEACSPRRHSARHRGVGGAPLMLAPGSVDWLAESAKQLAVHGYKRLPMSAGGGNSCLACSVSYQCTGSEAHHARFRAAVVLHEKHEAAFFRMKLPITRHWRSK